MAAYETELQVSQTHFDTEMPTLFQSIASEAALRYGQSRFAEGRNDMRWEIVRRIEAGETAEAIRVALCADLGVVPK